MESRNLVDKVKVSQVAKSFGLQGDARGQFWALEDVSVSVHASEMVALVGESGCGKTTLLRIIMGLETSSTGWVQVDGRVVDKPGYDRGMVFQNAELLPWRTAVENVELGLEMKGVGSKERRARAEHCLEFVGLGNSMEGRPDQLSGGMKSRVGIARALCIDPEVLLMDEPFGALDARTRERLQGELLRVHQNTAKTILFVTHDIDEAVLLASRVVVMDSAPGRVREVVDVDIPYPRSEPEMVRLSKEFVEKRHYIWELLKSAETATRERGAFGYEGEEVG